MADPLLRFVDGLVWLRRSFVKKRYVEEVRAKNCRVWSDLVARERYRRQIERVDEPENQRNTKPACR